MMKKLVFLVAVGVMLTFGSFAFAGDSRCYPGPALDILFLPTRQKYDTPYYRWYNEDWSWQHSAIASGFTTATLRISAMS